MRRYISKRLISLAVAALLVVVFYFFSGRPDGEPGNRETPAGDFKPLHFPRVPVGKVRSGQVRVLYVIDGDTIKVERSGRSVSVRLIGINAPELKGRRYSENQPGAVEASLWVENVLKPNPQVRLEYDVERRDKYDRLLAYVWYRQGGERRMLNEELVRAGLAVPKRYPPNTRHAERLKKARPRKRE